MRLIILDLTGHTELLTRDHPGPHAARAQEVDNVDEIIQRLEQEMNKGKRAIIEEPGKESVYAEKATDLLEHPDAQVSVFQPLVGG